MNNVSPGARLLAYLVDLGVLYVISFIVVFCLNETVGGVCLLLSTIVFAGRDSFNQGKGIGKKAMNIVVVQNDGKPVTFVLSIIRNITWFVPILNIVEAILIIAGQKRIGDKLAGTTVVKA